jgi:UDP-N-acetylglucosamine 2-epimerase (non-hydrolysing)
MSEAKIVITDSGGIQEETTVLGVPCLTVRDNTERPITTTEGTNILVGTERGKILNGYREIARTPKTYSRPQLWDGRASERIVKILLESLIDNKQLSEHKNVQ